MVEKKCRNGYTILDHSEEEFGKLEPYWRVLERGADMTAFQAYDWYAGLHTLYARERVKNMTRVWRYILILRDEVPVMIAPLEIKRMGIGYGSYGQSRGVYFIGRMGFTDYLNFIYDRFEADALKSLLEYVSQTYRQHRICFDRMLESSDSHRYLTQSYTVKTLPVSCAALVLPETFEDYRLSLSKSTRQNIRTAGNRESKNGLSLTHQLILDEDESVKQEILRLGEQRQKKKTARSRKEMSFAGSVYCFFADIYRRLFSAKLDVIHTGCGTFSFLVRDGERIVSYFWGIRNDHLREYYVILVGVDQEYEWYSPNIRHLYSFIEGYFSQGRGDIHIIDFTRGAEGYKKTIGCVQRPVSGVYFQYPQSGC